MFLDELSPFARELASHPVPFLGGLASGLLRLSLNDDPVKSWLAKQGVNPSIMTSDHDNHRNGDGPQSITID
ncbi:hypothetical protein [Nodosilinea sp. P-1105]|uniref:hypothetical protein n=1 Tax=Nodosilinea sp. P-1105 TaxID=2546229 RepID=UPI00146BB780|nr:hypothetical protein [Nodosilinea sp. P-1105]NMF84271.1 hypothetical protein [Nodosilinea sp. P-1105]